MVQIKGLQQALKNLQALQERTRKAMRRGEKKVADKIAADARSNAPVDKGLLIASIGVEQNENSTTVFAGAGYAAYQEFGTGPLVEVPLGLEDYAKEFKITGEGNTSPQPFFFPAVFKHQEEIVTAVEEELSKLVND